MTRLRIHPITLLVTGLAVVLTLVLLFALCAKKPKASTLAPERQTAFRKAFVMSVNPGQEAEYQKRHSPIWPELEETLKKHGMVTYTIFLDTDTRQLFGYVEFKDQAQWDAVAQTDICRRWWAHMKEIMPSNPDNSPVSKELKEVFHIEK
jgi:L-rhamnose mutarotase